MRMKGSEVFSILLYFKLYLWQVIQIFVTKFITYEYFTHEWVLDGKKVQDIYYAWNNKNVRIWGVGKTVYYSLEYAYILYLWPFLYICCTIHQCAGWISFLSSSKFISNTFNDSKNVLLLVESTCRATTLRWKEWEGIENWKKSCEILKSWDLWEIGWIVNKFCRYINFVLYK